MSKLCTTWLFAIVIVAGMALGTSAQTFTKLIAFNGSNGTYAAGGLVQGIDGSFYGVTSLGGANGNYGTLFRITQNGKLTTAYTFCSEPNCTDGYEPQSGLVLASDGNFYGTTAFGGDLSCRAPYGCGTVFRASPAGKVTTLHTF